MSLSVLLNRIDKIDAAPYTGLKWDQFYNTIDGELLTTKNTRHSINPATGEPNPEVPLSTKENVDAAMVAAKKSFKNWAATHVTMRKTAVLDFANVLEKEKEAFAQFLAQEQGKPITWARIELDTALNWIRTLASLDLPHEVIDEPTKQIVTEYIPLGVVVGIVPWNYLILLASSKIAAAVLTGNTVIIKPSPFTPAGDLKLCELAQSFFPEGVVQCLSGDDDLGPWLTEHPVPAKISFTGSTATGKLVMASAAKTLKKVTLELGGKDPAIVCEDVDIEDVAMKICLAIKRIFVHSKIYPQFRDALVAATKNLNMGSGRDFWNFLGPVQNAMQYEKVNSFFSDIEKDNLKVAIGGANPDGPGYFITPTIIDRPDADARIMIEEPFGPIVPLQSFDTYEEAIALANNTDSHANEIANQLEAGTVWVNTHFELDPRVPFGGLKGSGVGVELGVEGLKQFCGIRTLFLGKP